MPWRKTGSGKSRNFSSGLRREDNLVPLPGIQAEIDPSPHLIGTARPMRFLAG